MQRQEPVTTATLESQLESSTTAASRVLVVLVVTSLTIMYVSANAMGWLRPFERSASKTVATMDRDIQRLGPILALSDTLRRHDAIVRGYVQLVDQYTSLDAEALRSYADAQRDSGLHRIGGVTRQAIASNPSLGQLQADLLMYSPNDIRQEGLGGFEYFLRLFVTPDRSYDAPAIAKKLVLDRQVLESLGQPVPAPDLWPPVLLFSDYVDSMGADPSIDLAVRAAQRVPNPDSIVSRLIEYADRNDVHPVTLVAVQNDLHRDQFVADSTAAERIHVFLPVGVNRSVLVLLSPVALLFLTLLLASQLERRRHVVERLSERLVPSDVALLTAQWFVGRGGLSGPASAFGARVLMACAAGGILAPLAANVLVSMYLMHLRLPAAVLVFSWVLWSACTVVCAVQLPVLLRLHRDDRASRARGVVAPRVQVTGLPDTRPSAER